MSIRRILHIIPYMDPINGGPPVVVAQLAIQGIEHGDSTSVLTSQLGCKNGSKALSQYYGDAFPMQILPARTSLELWLVKSRKAVFRQVAESDIVVVHTLWNALNVWARQACRIYGKPYLLMPHGMLDPYSINIKSAKKKFYLNLFEKKNLNQASRLLFTTEEEVFLATQSISNLPPPVIVPLGAEVPIDSDNDAMEKQFLEKYAIAKNRQCLLFLSRIHPIKGLDRLLPLLVDLVKELPSLLLIVAGSGEIQYLERLKQKVVQLNLEQFVLFTGMLQGALKWGAFSSAIAFVLPSHHENFAIVVAEAMHMGLPVILTENVNTSPYIQKVSAGFVINEADFSVSFQNAIREIFAHPHRAKEMGARGKFLAQSELTWQCAGKIMDDCFHQII